MVLNGEADKFTVSLFEEYQLCNAHSVPDAQYLITYYIVKRYSGD